MGRNNTQKTPILKGLWFQIASWKSQLLPQIPQKNRRKSQNGIANGGVSKIADSKLQCLLHLKELWQVEGSQTFMNKKPQRYFIVWCWCTDCHWASNALNGASAHNFYDNRSLWNDNTCFDNINLGPATTQNLAVKFNGEICGGVLVENASGDFPSKRSSKNLLPNFAGSSPPISPKTSPTSLWKSLVLINCIFFQILLLWNFQG